VRPTPPLIFGLLSFKNCVSPDRFKYYQGEKTMKLNLIFIVMYVLTLFAYPVVFMHGKLRWFFKSKESIPLTNILVPVAITPDR
jgi:hypothetical protein